MKKETVYYKALKSRDPRFDGKFFAGVKTTGIYCRPICPARPHRKNVEFFGSQLEAERAGYRPCLRCRPESAPRSPAWIGKSAVVQRALKSLACNEVLALDENIFAAKFGVTPRHLRRLFKEEIGKSPKQIAFENRLNLARKLLAETHLSVSQAAFASEFSSIRRFNDAFKKRFKKSPRAIIRAPLDRQENLKLSAPYRPPFHFQALLTHYRSHRVGDLEWFDDERMHRLVHFGDAVGIISIKDDPARSQLIVEIDFSDTTKIHEIVSRVRAMFDLDSDPIGVAEALSVDREFKGLLKKHEGIRLPSGWDAFEIGIATILGQFVSVDRGRALVGDLIEMLGVGSGFFHKGKEIKLFGARATWH